MYTVLARKYRSQTFDEVVGQDPIVQTLKNAIKTGKIAHSFLFTGTRGVGKTTMARLLAKSLNCLGSDAPTVQPCCECESCIAVNLGEDIDVIEIDGATNNGVDQVRQLRENALYRPARARFKIYIIDEVHMLSTGAFNALLKILEEPPTHVKFIFATTEPNKVIPTIQSRCQKFDFTNISAPLIAGQLSRVLDTEQIKYDNDIILPLAKMANGSMRDGLSLLDKLISTGIEPLGAALLETFLGCPNSQKLCNLIAAIGDSDAAGTLDAAEDLINTGLSEVQIVDALVDYMRDLMVLKSTGPDSTLLALTAQQKEQLTKLADKFDTAGLVYSITALEKIRWLVKNSNQSRALLEACLLRFALSEHFLNVDQLLRQVQSLADTELKKKHTHPEQNPNHENKNNLASCGTYTGDSSLQLSDLESIKSSWQAVLAVVQRHLGSGTRPLLSCAVPTAFEDGVLTLTFEPSAKMQKKMCESNDRLQALQSLLNKYTSAPIMVKLEIAPQQSGLELPQRPPAGRIAAENDIINHPAVKSVLVGFDATITAIELPAEND